MVKLFNPLSCFALLALVASTVQAAPIPKQTKREVGTLTCYTTKIGTLSLVNTKTKKRKYATFQNKYTLKQEMEGKQIPEDAKYWQNAPLLSSFSSVKKDAAKFEFLQCDESQNPGFEDFPPEDKNGIHYGHLSPISSNKPLTSENPPNCATHRQLYGDTAYLTSEGCNFSDDSGSVLSYFSYSPNKNGQINFLGYTGPKGAEPETKEQKQGAYDFTPGTNAKDPAVNVHDGTEQFSDWVLRLE